jgi:uncharacterized membrane protein
MADSDQDSKKKSLEEHRFTGIGLSLGLSFGVAFGAAFGDVSNGLIIGMIVGMLIGAVMDVQERKQSKDAN